MFPIDKRTAINIWYPAPDVIPELCFALDDVPLEQWNSHSDLYELADDIEPTLIKHGARKWDFIWSMERHFSWPYGPLPKAKQRFMAGIPDFFLGDEAGVIDVGREHVNGNGNGVRDAALEVQRGLNRARPQDFEVLAKPYQYEAESDMPEEFRFWLEKLFIAHGECMMPYFGERAKGHRGSFESVDQFSLQNAPDPESRLRMSNFANEEYKHTYQFYKIYHAFDPEIPVTIYEREREIFRAYESMKAEPTWLDRCINNMLSDRFGVYQGFEWVQSSYAPLARVSMKVVKDERGHSNCGYIHVRAALERDPNLRAVANDRVQNYWYPYFMDAFGSNDSKNNLNWRRWGLKQHTNDELRQAYHVEVTEMLASLGLEPGDISASHRDRDALAVVPRMGN